MTTESGTDSEAKQPQENKETEKEKAKAAEAASPQNQPVQLPAAAGHSTPARKQQVSLGTVASSQMLFKEKELNGFHQELTRKKYEERGDIYVPCSVFSSDFHSKTWLFGSSYCLTSGTWHKFLLISVRPHTQTKRMYSLEFFLKWKHIKIQPQPSCSRCG